MNIQETIQLMKSALGNPVAAHDISKSITTGTGLVAYDLQAPAKNLYPVNTPIRNTIPRVGGGTGKATNWNVVSGLVGSGFNAMPWVPEGQRSARMSYVTGNKSAAYVTIGEEDQATYEAINAGKGYEDIKANMTMRLLQKLFLKEEDAILGGNATVLLGTPAAPTVTNAGTGGTVAAGTYNVMAVALTYEGFRNSSVANGVATSQTITGADGQQYTLSGGSSNKSAAGSTTTTGATSVINASVAAIQGAVAYAWFVGTAGNERLAAITSINSAVITALNGAGQLASAVTADNSRNANYAFDGLLSTAFAPASGAYLQSLATGVVGTGTPLTSSGRGSVNEIDNMLYSMWNNYQVSPTILFMNAQELKNVTTKVLSSGSAPLLNYFATAESGATALVAGTNIQFYFNPFALGGGNKIPVMIHPTLPPGTILAYCDNLPAQYKSTNVPNVAEVHTRADYYQIDWPLRTRAQEVGVYAEEVLAIYAPFTLGIINNIANG